MDKLANRLPAAWSENLLRFLVAGGMLLYGLWSVPLALFENDWNMIPGDWGDARFNNYILEHGYRFMTGREHSYWDAPVMYPYQNVIAFSDNLLGTMPFYSAFRSAGFDRETSLQCWILLLFTLNYLFAFWTLQRWLGNLALSAAGAYIFAFGIFITGQVNHLQVFPRFMVPPVMYFTWMYLRERKNRDLALLLAGLVYQFYCAIYLGFILFYCQLCMVAGYLLVYGRKTFRPVIVKQAWKPVAIAVAAIIVFLPLILPYIQISRVTGMRNFAELQSTLPRPVSYFFTHPAATTWKGILSEHSQYAFDDWWFHFMFMGALPWAGLVIAVVQLARFRGNKALAVYVLALLLAFLFSTRFGEFSLYRLVHMIPGFSSMRSIDRFINVLSWLFILVLVAGAGQWAGKLKYGRRLVFLVPLLAILDNRIEPWELKRFYKDESQKEIAAVREIFLKNYDGRSKAVALMTTNVDMQLPSYHDKLIRDHLSIMIAAQDLGIPVVNAYTGHYPPGYMSFFDHRDEESLSRWLGANGHLGNNVQRIYAPVGQANR